MTSFTCLIMAILNSVAECLAYIEKSKVEFPVLHDIISSDELLAWEEKLGGVPSLADFLMGPVGEEESLDDAPNSETSWEEASPLQQAEVSKWNLLNVTFTVGFCRANGHATAIGQHAERLLAKLSLYLETFPELIADKRFLGKGVSLESEQKPTLSKFSQPFLPTSGAA